MFLSRVKNLVQESAARRSQAREQSQQQRRTKSPGIGETATDEQLKETEKEKETATTTKPQTSTSPAPSTSGFWSLYRRDRGAAGSEKEKDKEKEGDGGSSQEPEREKTELVPPKTETEKEKEKEREPRTVDEAIAQFFEKNGRRQTKTFTGRDRLPLRRLEGTGATRREVCGRVEVSIECGCALASRTPSLLLHIDGSEAKAEDPVAWPQTEQGGGGRFVFASAQGGGEGVNAKIENGRAIFSFEIRDIRSSLFILLVERERLLQRLRVVGRICVFPSGWSAFDGGHPGETHLLPQRKRRGGGSSPQWVEFFPVSKRGALLPSAAERTAGLMANVYKFEAGVKFAKGSAMARPRSPLGVLQLSVSFSLAVPALKALSVPLSAAAAGGEEGEQGQPGESRDKKGAAEGEEGDDFGVDILTIRRNFLRLGDALPFPVLLRIFLSSMPGLIFICALWAFICLTAEPWMWPVWVFTVILSNGVASHFLTLPAPPRVAHPSVEGLLLREYGGVAAAASVPPRTRPGGLLAGGERDLLESAGEGREDGEREIYRGSDAGGGQVDDGPFVARSNSSLSVVSPSPPRTQLNVNGRTTPPVSRSPPRRLLGGQAAKTAEAPISPRPVVVKQRETPKWLSDLAEDLGIPLPRQNPKSLLRPLPLLQRRRVLLWEDDRDLQGEEDASALSLRQKYRKVFYGVATFQSKCGEIASKAERLSNAFNFADVQISATIHASCALICVLLSVLLHLLPLRLFFAIAGE
uniref:Uncharacterized protein n=1 Tax=Chromera velia CCMP2878 TaxID=1169474 RepID=A0A0G4F5P2_9ALVE|eukprot:Cvel_15123.t1-p1 / transcript=Cvel_15123.t1 / gene=Cvel_15123 / organism=Chromera_velia_CCMP2878 / gene_product=hypothetical protein / transcript_product=hypothetical protein / location=Cvel_scaffold1104:807-7418(-) / protein_length=752 / sequence_SO=supercontig / SO=protein_coding / is_pseudo=false